MLTFPMTNTQGHKITLDGEEVCIDLGNGSEFLGLLQKRSMGTFFVRPSVKDSKHLFRKADSGSYYTPVSNMLDKGVVRMFNNSNEQIFLPRDLFTRAGA